MRVIEPDQVLLECGLILLPWQMVADDYRDLWSKIVDRTAIGVLR
jgi:hypothetical protein